MANLLTGDDATFDTTIGNWETGPTLTPVTAALLQETGPPTPHAGSGLLRVKPLAAPNVIGFNTSLPMNGDGTITEDPTDGIAPIASGDLILLWVTAPGTATFTFPTGFTTETAVSVGGTTPFTGQFGYKVADGSEATIAVSATGVTGFWGWNANVLRDTSLSAGTFTQSTATGVSSLNVGSFSLSPGQTLWSMGATDTTSTVVPQPQAQSFLSGPSSGAHGQVGIETWWTAAGSTGSRTWSRTSGTGGMWVTGIVLDEGGTPETTAQAMLDTTLYPMTVDQRMRFSAWAWPGTVGGDVRLEAKLLRYNAIVSSEVVVATLTDDLIAGQWNRLSGVATSTSAGDWAIRLKFTRQAGGALAKTDELWISDVFLGPQDRPTPLRLRQRRDDLTGSPRLPSFRYGQRTSIRLGAGSHD